jgi:hypothetical protein
MKFGQRLWRYIIGFGLGCLMVYWMFPNHDWLGWLPGKQIRQNIRNSTIQFTPKALCVMENQVISEADWRNLLEDGSINFDQSDTHANEKKYTIENDLMMMQFIIQDTISLVTEISRIGLSVPEQCQP